MSQRSATVLGVYNGMLYIEHSVVSTANSYVLKSANGKAKGKAKGKATAEFIKYGHEKVPKTLYALILKKETKRQRLCAYCYGCTGALRVLYGRFSMAEGSIKLRLQSLQPLF